MTWTDPTTRSTGDLVTAAIWNADVVDNLEFLHDRVVERWFYVAHTTNYAADGRWRVITLTAGSGAAMAFSLPEDFDELVSADVLLIANATGTLTYSIHTAYGADGESKINHYESSSGNTTGMTNGNLKLVGADAALSALAADDLGTVQLYVDPGSSIGCEVVGLRLRYTRT